MNRIKALLIIALAMVVAAPSIALAAGRPSSTGSISIQVHDQSGRSISGSWFMHEGTNAQGSILRNGSTDEKFRYGTGAYFLRAENKRGYEKVEITTENPQTLAPNGGIFFQVVYYEEGAAAEQAAAAAMMEETPVAPEEETPPLPPTQTPPQATSPQFRPILTQDTLPPPAETTDLFNRSHLDRSPLPAPAYRPAVTPARPVAIAPAPVARPASAPFELPATGPAGLLALLLASGVSGLAIVRKSR